MATIKDWIDKLSQVGNKNKVNAIVRDIVMRNKAQIIDLQLSQLDDGIDIHGQVVGYYAASTQTFATESIVGTQQPKIFGEPYNFDWTGRFRKGIFIRYNRGTITFHSRGMGSGEKRSFIEFRAVLGLTEENQRIVNEEIIRPQFIEAFKNL